MTNTKYSDKKESENNYYQIRKDFLKTGITGLTRLLVTGAFILQGCAGAIYVTPKGEIDPTRSYSDTEKECENLDSNTIVKYAVASKENGFFVVSNNKKLDPVGIKGKRPRNLENVAIQELKNYLLQNPHKTSFRGIKEGKVREKVKGFFDYSPSVKGLDICIGQINMGPGKSPSDPTLWYDGEVVEIRTKGFVSESDGGGSGGGGSGGSGGSSGGGGDGGGSGGAHLFKQLNKDFANIKLRQLNEDYTNITYFDMRKNEK